MPPSFEVAADLLTFFPANSFTVRHFEMKE